MKNRKMVFRADGSKAGGFGHLSRCAILAEQFRQRGYEILFSTAMPDEKVAAFLAARGFDFEPAPPLSGDEGGKALADVMRRWGAQAALLDSYAIDETFSSRLKSEGMFVAALDDGDGRWANADAVINVNPSADPARYAGFKGALMAGPQYALIDPRFALERRHRMPNPSIAHPAVLVALGGTDNLNQQGRVLKILDAVEGDFSILGIAGVYSASAELAGLGLKHPCDILRFSRNMPSAIAGCDAAITAAGTMCMELACVGVPFVALMTDSRQLDNARVWANAGCAMYAGALWELSDNALYAAFAAFMRERDAWLSMAEAGRRMVDGLGAERVAERLEEVFNR